MSETTTDSGLASRRAVLAGAAGVGAAAALAACGDNSASGSSTGDDTSGDDGNNGNTSNASGVIAKKSDIPVGGGKIFKEQKVVITQPSAEQFKAFDATCKHQACLVTSVEGGTINCDCHGSKYAIADGSVKNGPTTQPLDPKTVTVDGDNLKVS
jgi:Rieske Fe-S protein